MSVGQPVFGVRCGWLGVGPRNLVKSLKMRVWKWRIESSERLAVRSALTTVQGLARAVSLDLFCGAPNSIVHCALG